MSARVVVLDYGSGNVHSAVRMLERVGADVELTADPRRCWPRTACSCRGSGNFHACMRGLRAVGGAPADRAAAGRRPPGDGVCVGMQVLFDGSSETNVAGERARAGGVARHRRPAAGGGRAAHGLVRGDGRRRGRGCSRGSSDERFYFVHSYAVQKWELEVEGPFAAVAPKVTWAEHGAPFVAAVENGPLWATQFHPEKSGDAGAHLLRNWVESL